MKSIELAAVQERFADIVWANEPISSGDLVKVCEKELNWKKPTTYTVLRKLCEKGASSKCGWYSFFSDQQRKFLFCQK